MATARDDLSAALDPACPHDEGERRIDAYRAEIRRETLVEAEAKAREVVARLWGGGITQTQLDRTDGARAVELEIGLLAATTAPAPSDPGSST